MDYITKKGAFEWSKLRGFKCGVIDTVFFSLLGKYKFTKTQSVVLWQVIRKDVHNEKQELFFVMYHSTGVVQQFLVLYSCCSTIGKICSFS